MLDEKPKLISLRTSLSVPANEIFIRKKENPTSC